jgi:hypothetical protein
MCVFQLVDNYLKSVDNFVPLDKIGGFLVGLVKFFKNRETVSRTAFLSLSFEFLAPGR